ncbi:Zinc finger BED domain-containing protein 4 [Chionoecetes opilio]|uniref:Zinc finger BED domain-containing protein 4 n=3 Tax=Chionoecetes opilio TaxID=41210 RepID=A0A8J4XQC9_CHIOP|nr:Zinc finger BED domain-containing protein 4 [Chionoecetes opilio]
MSPKFTTGTMGGAAPFKKTLARAQGLWNLQNRSSTSANTIKQVVGRKLPTPVVTRWNSLYDACSVLLQRVMDDDARLEAVNEVLRNEGGTNRNRTSYYGFDDQDKQVLQEYCKVMKPLANCLDRLQTEENAYLGVLLPTLTLMRVALERMEEARGDQALTYAKPLVRALLRQEGNKGGFNNRFSAMFKDLDLLMASALHPNYGMTTFNSVAPNMKEEIFQRIVKEMKALIRQETEERDNSQDMEAMEEHEEVSADPFAELCDTTQADQEDDLEEDIKKELLAWKRSKEATLKKSHFPAKYRDQWVTLFIKYNTGIPSSAAVERLFSTAGDVLRPKRACLSEDNFEYLVFLKGNLHLLKQKFKVPRGVDEEDEEMF